MTTALADPEVYRRKKDRERARNARINLAGRDFTESIRVADPGRRAATAGDFGRFCREYFPLTFHLPWCDDHRRVIGQIESSVVRGGLFATAMPRGSGKTSLVEAACIWAVLNGYHPFVALIGSDESHAEDMLDSIKSELELNDLLADDFPEACRPIAALEGIANRCKGQLYHGERTHVEWTAKAIVLPTLSPDGWPDMEDHGAFLRPGGRSLASGAIIRVAGLTGGIRGMKFKTADGRTVRPTLVIPDDPQTDESARSPSQCETRERILAGAVLGLAGPGEKISGIMPCTVIAPGDMADRILDRRKHPDWNGTRTRMVYSFPDEEKLWEEYRRIRDDGLRAQRGIGEATEFYRAHRDAMDAGAVVAWPERFERDELSAVQHAMNLRFRDERAFWSEYQNQPLPPDDGHADDLTPDQIAARTNRHRRGLVPAGCERITAFVDVQASLLYYVVCAWEDDFTGAVIDYGTFPDQKRPYFTLKDAKSTLARSVKAAGLEGLIYGGLERVAELILGRPWPRDDGAELRVERCLIDANWGDSTRVIHQFCRASTHAAVLSPSHGMGIRAGGRPMAEWSKKPGEKAGLNWRLGPSPEVKGARKVVFDANWWKTFLHSRLTTAMGDRGALALFGDRPELHRMFADHLCSEYRTRTEGRGRVVHEWHHRPERPDNHLLDCVVGCCVAASIQGVTLAEAKDAPAVTRKRVSFAAMQRERRA